MSTGFGYDTYNNLAVLVPVFSSVSLVALHFILSFIMNICEGDEARIQFLFIYSKVIFYGVLKKDKKKKISFHDYEIHNWCLFLLSSVTTFVLICAFFSFWAAFLFNETFVCDPRLDCFVKNSTTNSFVPVSDCATVGDNAKVECYQFKFDVSEGFSYAVGFFAVAVAYICLYSSVLIWLMKKYQNSTNTNQNPTNTDQNPTNTNHTCQNSFIKYCLLISWGFATVLPVIFLIVFCSILIYVPSFRAITLSTKEKWLKFMAYFLCFLYCGPIVSMIISWYLRDKIRSKLKDDAKKLEQELKEQSAST